MMDNGWSMNGWGWMIFAIVIAAVVVALIFRMNSSDSTTLRRASSDDAEKVLRKRFAAGEIDEAEFRRRRETLSV